MKSLRMNRDRSLHFLYLPDPPAPSPTEVRVQMAYASICGYDMMMLSGQAAYPKHGMIGHEGSGIVQAVGANVDDFRVGDRVTINPYHTCGQCDACRSNRPHYCINPDIRMNMMTEIVNCDQKYLYRLPNEVSLKVGCLTEPLMMAMYAVTKANLSFGKSVILLGCGAMGQIILKLVRQHTAGKIVVVEPIASKREAALRFGADLALDPTSCNAVSEALIDSGGLGYDAVIETSGNRAAAHNALNLVARGGSVVFFALYGMNYNLELNLFNLYWKDASVCAVCVPSGQFPTALKIAGRLKLEEVISAIYKFDDAEAAFREKATGQHAKVMLEFTRDG